MKSEVEQKKESGKIKQKNESGNIKKDKGIKKIKEASKKNASNGRKRTQRFNQEPSSGTSLFYFFPDPKK